MRFSIFLILLTSSLVLNSQDSFSLDEAIDYAIQNSAAIESAKIDVKIAAAQTKEYKSIGLPQVNGGLDYNHYFYTPVTPIDDFLTPAIYGVLENEFPGEVTRPSGNPEQFNFSVFTKNNITAKVDGSMLLFDGSYLVGLEASRLFKELTEQKIAVQEEEIRAAITKAYMNVLIYKKNKETIVKNIDNIKQALKEARAYYDSGFMESLDVDRILLSLENISIQEQNINRLIKLGLDLLKYQMHYPVDKDLTLNENIEDLIVRLEADNVSDLVKIDFNKRPEYAQILMGQEMNELNLKRHQKSYLPSLRARAGISESLQRNKLFDGDEAGWLPTVYAGVALNIPILDGKSKQAKIEQTRLDIQKTELQKNEYERGIILQVKNSYAQYIIAKSSVKNNKRALGLVENIYNKTLIKFKEGVGSSIEVTQAESQLYEAQANYINALYNLLISKTDLDIALGTI